MSKITPCLWFDTQGEDAAGFYVDTFREAGLTAELGAIARYGPGGPGPEGSVMTVAFTLAEQNFLALNGGPAYKFSPAISMSIDCADQAEVDHFWGRLLEGGRESRCGWLDDRFGLSWQIVPHALPDLLSRGDAAQKKRVMAAMLTMVKLDVAALERAFAGP